MDKVTKFVGIDVSKDTLDVSTSEGKHFQFSNDNSGHKMLSELLDPESQCVMEATASYHQTLSSWLHANGFLVSVVNPLVIKRFVQMRLRLAKTDKADAEMIRLYGETERPSLWIPPQEFVAQAFEINSTVMLLIRQRTALKNKLHSVQHKPGKFSVILKSLEKQIKMIDTQVQILESTMEELIRENQHSLFDRLCSIPGIGKKTAMFLIVITNGFEKFDSSKQLSAYLGLAPTIKRSGSSVRGQSRISKTGNSAIRNLLFMCSFTACERNKACRELFNRIVEKGKSRKLALIAVANKLLKQSLAIAKSGEYYEENYKSVNPSCIQ
jgi:transposase